MTPDTVLWVAGMRALLLQSLHPRVMRGTYQNSALFDPKKAWPRFQRTVEFVARPRPGPGLPQGEQQRPGDQLRGIAQRAGDLVGIG